MNKAEYRRIRDLVEAEDTVWQKGGEEGDKLIEHVGWLIGQHQHEVFHSAVVKSENPRRLGCNGDGECENTTQLSRCLVWNEMDDPSSIVVSLSRQRIKATEVILGMRREGMKIP